MTKEELLKDIIQNPQNHKHDYKSLYDCCCLNGILDTELLDAHSKYAPLGENGGVT